jgi:hypothetical protein
MRVYTQVHTGAPPFPPAAPSPPPAASALTASRTGPWRRRRGQINNARDARSGWSTCTFRNTMPPAQPNRQGGSLGEFPRGLCRLVRPHKLRLHVPDGALEVCHQGVEGELLGHLARWWADGAGLTMFDFA